MNKILWFSNYRFSDKADSSTGTWLGAMGRGLMASNEVKLFNVTEGWVTDIVHEQWGEIEQWVLPRRWKRMRNGLPSSGRVCQIAEIVTSIAPNLVHVWGLENYFGLLLARKKFGSVKGLIDIQGILHAIAPFYMGGLTGEEQRQCRGLKEFLRPSCYIGRRCEGFRRAESREVEIIQGCDNISYQSEWTHGHLSVLNPKARVFKTLRMLRREFIDATPWRFEDRGKTPLIFATCGAAVPYKGVHVLLRAVAALKKSGQVPKSIQVRIAGDRGGCGLKRAGYAKWVESEITRLDLVGNVKFLGPLPASELIREFRAASVFVHPSFIESYSLAVAEAMAMGMPCVISYAGAMPELAHEGVSALYYPMGDWVSCARRIMEILNSPERACQLGLAALNQAKARTDVEQVVERQLEIYHAVLSD